MSRKRYKKVTTVSKDIFGNKRIETERVPVENGVGTIIVLVILYFFFIRGCG
jgi:hypothetical protein